MSDTLPDALRLGGRERRGLFLIGAPRCGTTSISKALRRHPQLCVSKPKETYFFLRPPPGLSPEQRGESFARAYLPHLQPQHRVVVEATPHHLYSDTAIERILAFDSQARFLVCVRNPVDLVYSHHARVLFTMDEDEHDFARAWALQEQRARGESLPRRCRDPHFVQYRALGCLGARIEALFGRVGRARCHVIVYDDLVAKGAGVLPELLRFAGVDAGAPLELARHQRHAVYRFAWLQPLVMNPPKPVARIAEGWERSGRGRAGFLKPLRKRVKQWNLRTPERPPLDPQLRRSLAAEFAADVEKLGALLGRDLGHWR